MGQNDAPTIPGRRQFLRNDRTQGNHLTFSGELCQGSHADLDAVQRNFVDAQGRVDFAGLKRSPGNLDRYYLWLNQESPHLSAQRFPPPNTKSPTGSTPTMPQSWSPPFSTTPYPASPTSGVTCPSASSIKASASLSCRGFSLAELLPAWNDLKAAALEPSYHDPRIHFALSDASVGSPGLAPEAFRAENSTPNSTQRPVVSSPTLSISLLTTQKKRFFYLR